MMHETRTVWKDGIDIDVCNIDCPACRIVHLEAELAVARTLLNCQEVEFEEWWKERKHATSYPEGEARLAFCAGRAALRSQLKNITENAYILENTIRLLRTENADWKCKANPTADPPQDCDFPFCGCDPNAIKVIETLQESGWIGPKEACDREKAAIAAARLEEAEWWEHLAPDCGMPPSGNPDCIYCQRLAEIRSGITPDQSAARGGASTSTEKSQCEPGSLAEGSARTER